MRIIAGEFRSRRLKSMSGMDVRPTPDRLRETLFNVLSSQVADCVFVDAYAGTGAVGIEALSRGARKVVLIERSRGAAALIHENLRALGIENRASVVLGKAAHLLPRWPAGIVFLDPPYMREEEYEAAMRALADAPPPLVVAQHSSHFDLKDSYGPLRRYRTLKQGDNTLSFYAPRKDEDADGPA